MNSVRLFPLLSLAIVACALSQASDAATYNGSGIVYVLNADDLSVFGANTDWFELNGVSSMGNCKGWGQGTLFRMKDDAHGQQMYATLLAAYLAQATVTVYADDTYTDSSGNCYAEQVVLGTMP